MTLHAKMAIPKKQRYSLNLCLIWITYQCFRFFNLFIFICDFYAKATFVLFLRSNVETNGNKRFSSHENHGISSTLGLLGYHCKSGVAIFAWRVTWKYANIPFKQLSYRVTHKGCDFRDDIQNWPSFISTFLVFFSII